MRDDIIALYRTLDALYSSKLKLLLKLHSSETDKHHYLAQHNVDKVTQLLEEDSKNINTINDLDYTIRNNTDKICSLCGIDFNDFGELTGELEDTLARSVLEKINDCGNVLRELLKKRNHLLPRLEAEMHETEKDLRELHTLQKIKKRL